MRVLKTKISKFVVKMSKPKHKCRWTKPKHRHKTKTKTNKKHHKLSKKLPKINLNPKIHPPYPSPPSKLSKHSPNLNPNQSYHPHHKNNNKMTKFHKIYQKIIINKTVPRTLKYKYKFKWHQKQKKMYNQLIKKISLGASLKFIGENNYNV